MRNSTENKLTRICIGFYLSISIITFIVWILLLVVPDNILSSFVVHKTMELGDTQRIAAAGNELLRHEINHIIQSVKPIMLMLSIGLLSWTILWKFIFKKSIIIQKETSPITSINNIGIVGNI